MSELYNQENSKSGTILPILGSLAVHKTDGDVTVVDVKKKGRGYYVLYSTYSGEVRRARLKDWHRATA